MQQPCSPKRGVPEAAGVYTMKVATEAPADSFETFVRLDWSACIPKRELVVVIPGEGAVALSGVLNEYGDAVTFFGPWPSAEELERLVAGRGAKDNAEGILASFADRLNVYARENQLTEVSDYLSLPLMLDAIDRTLGHASALRAEVAAHESEMGQLIDERDRANDALSRTHVALGGDGEWCAKPGQECVAGETGDLAIDVPAIAEGATTIDSEESAVVYMWLATKLGWAQEINLGLSEKYPSDAIYLDPLPRAASAIVKRVDELEAEVARLEAERDEYQGVPSAYIEDNARLRAALEEADRDEVRRMGEDYVDRILGAGAGGNDGEG